MLLDVSLEVVLHGELSAALVADEWPESLVGAHVLLQQVLTQVRLTPHNGIVHISDSVLRIHEILIQIRIRMRIRIPLFSSETFKTSLFHRYFAYYFF